MESKGKRLVRMLKRLLVLALVAGVGLLVIGSAPGQWMVLGEKAALLAVSLQQPVGSMALLTEQWAAEEQQTAVTQPPKELPTAATQQAVTAVIPPKTAGGGTINEQQLDTGTPVVGKAAVRNGSGVDYDLAGLFGGGNPVVLADTAEPQVLIVHTHTTEGYMSYYAGYYNDDDETRSTDESQNVCAVGEAIAAPLRAAGIGVLHDTTLHDYPQYTGAYERSAQTIAAQLAAHPSIKVVLDIHRDAMMPDDVTKLKPTATVAGRKAAQLMILVGATNTDSLPNPNCAQNLAFGLKLQDRLVGLYDGLMRPLYMVDARYNQDQLVGSLLVEVGTDANTLSEALYGGELLGNGLAALLKSL